MCGIAGHIGKRPITEDRIRATLGLMKNRGPDYRNFVNINNGDVTVTLLHSRLSIIDLDARSNQPFTIDDYTLVFNGEIYNYIELRQQLEKKGVSFKTKSDTEVLLRCYIEFGEDCVKYFEGMWSLAIYDRKKRTLFLSRDRFAEKPLYILKYPHGIFFASEIKFLKSLSGLSLTVNPQHLHRYLVNGYKSLYKSQETFFNEVAEIPYATSTVIGHNLNPISKRYWNPSYSPQDMTLSDAIKGFRQRLLDSIKLRLRADVPLAFCLSGGLDSAAIVSIAAKHFNYDVHTFSIIDTDARYNERENMQATIEDVGCKHTLIDIPKADVFNRLKDLIKYHDSPLSTISYYIHAFLSEAIFNNGYRVVCSGTGADELVTGYYDHFNLYLYETRNNANYPKYLEDWKSNIAHFVRNPHLKNPELYFNNPSFRDHIYLNNDLFSTYTKTGFMETFTETEFCDSLLRNRMMNEMFHESISVILHEDDLNSMLYSIENRSPYLDSRLFEFSYSIPTEHLIQNAYGKYILREAVKGILNEKVRTDRQKKGFNASIHSIVDLSKKENKDYLLADDKVFEFVEKNKIAKLLEHEYPMSNSYSKFLFNFINAKIFLQLNG